MSIKEVVRKRKEIFKMFQELMSYFKRDQDVLNKTIHVCNESFYYIIVIIFSISLNRCLFQYNS